MALAHLLSERLHDTKYADIPREVSEYAKLLALSATGAAVRGSREPAGRLVAEYVRDLGGRGEAGVFGWRFRTTLENAAMANNTFFWPAEATLPRDWRMMGVVRGPREIDPAIHSDSWMAWARGPDGQRVDGQGDTPDAALRDFVKRMRESGQAFSVE